MNKRLALWISIGALAISMVSAWIAVGQLADATEAGLNRTSEALRTARTVAASTADSAAELQRMVQVVADGIGSVGEAVTATESVSAATRKALSSIRFIDSVQGVRESLENAEASLQTIRGDLDRSRTTLAEAVPELNKTVTALKAVPADLDRSIAQVAESMDKIDAQRLLWRLAILAGGLGLIGGLVVVERLVRESTERDAPIAMLPPSAPPPTI